MLSGAISREVSASRSSATFLPEKSRPRDFASAAGFVAADAALPAVLRAVCCRPRALPPAFAARLREAELRELVPPLREDELRAELPLREELLRADEPLLEELLRGDDPLREDELRDDPLREEPLDEPRDEPPLDEPRDDPPREPPDDPPLPLLLELRSESAMSRSSSAPRYGRDYATSKRAATGA